MTNIGKLTWRQAREGLRLPGGRANVRYGDGGGLYVQITKTATGSETRAWLFRFTSPVTGKKRDMGLGSLATLKLDEAREVAREARKLLLQGIDPIDARIASRAELKATARRMISFDKAVEGYLKDHSSTWTNVVHRKQWVTTLAGLPEFFCTMQVHLIQKADVVKVLEGIWHEKPETASRIRARIEKVLGWCTGRGYRTGLNPARWKENLDAVLARPAKLKRTKKPDIERRHAAMPYDDVPSFMARLRGTDARLARFLETLILTGVRLGELSKARWNELDLANRKWTIPPEKTKHRKQPHQVALSPRVVSILEDLPRGEDASGLVFPSEIVPRNPISPKPVHKLLVELTAPVTAGKKLTLHGFRSSFSSWRAARTPFPADAAEAQLGHLIGKSDVARAYQRDDLLEVRHKLMAAWERFCSTPRNEAGEVIPLRPTAEAPRDD
jgi:integrase